MKAQCLWFFLLFGSLIASYAAASGQAAPGTDDGSNLIDPEGILHELAPDTIPLDSLNPKPANRPRAIRLLLAVKRQNTGWNRQEAVYLLTLLGHNYVSNRDELLKVWNGCVDKQEGTDCDERTALALIGLYAHGHTETLHPLLAACRNSDGALSDALGPFYAERLELNAKEFVAMLSAFPPKEQRRICWLAGTEDGGGMSPKEERKVLANLKEVGGNLADRCSRSIHTGSREADQSNSDPPAAAQPQN